MRASTLSAGLVALLCLFVAAQAQKTTQQLGDGQLKDRELASLHVSLNNSKPASACHHAPTALARLHASRLCAPLCAGEALIALKGAVAANGFGTSKLR
jgi:hypothetical protein